MVSKPFARTPIMKSTPTPDAFATGETFDIATANSLKSVADDAATAANLSAISSAWLAARPNPLTADVKYLTASWALIPATLADLAATSASSIASFIVRPCFKNSTTTPETSDVAKPVFLASCW